MTYITRLSKSSLDFIAKLTSNSTSRSIPASMALGRTLSNNLSMPTSPVDNIVQYFKVQNQIAIEATISQINEMVALDRASVLDNVIKFYELRYASLFPAEHVIALNKQTAIVDFFSISRYFDNVSLSMIESNPIFMTDLVNNFKKLINELQGVANVTE